MPNAGAAPAEGSGPGAGYRETRPGAIQQVSRRMELDLAKITAPQLSSPLPSLANRLPPTQDH